MARSAPGRVGLLATEMTTHGGIQSYLHRTLEVLAQRVGEQYGEVCCISLNDSTDALSSQVDPVVRVWGAARSKLRFLARLLFVSGRFDVLVVSHLALAPVARLLASLGRVRRYAVQIYGVEAWRRVPAVERWGVRRADAIVAITRYTAEEFRRNNNVARATIAVVRPCAAEGPRVRDPGFRLAGSFKLLCVARQDASERGKGFETMFHALGELIQKHPGIHLNLVGEGDDQARLRAYSQKLGLGASVTFWGALTDEELAAAYVDCDVFVMPSRQEGFGIVFLEAMAAAKPCIGGRHGGTPEVIEDGRSGYLVAFGDSGELAARLIKLREDDELRRRMGERGRQLVTTEFSLRAFAEGYDRILSSMVA